MRAATVRRNRAVPPKPAVPIMARREADGSLTIHLPEPPSANRWWRMVTIKGQARMLLSREARLYKQAVYTALVARGLLEPIPPGVSLSVRVTWWRSRRAGDLDKRLGVALDAMQGTVYVSDAQIAHLEANRRDGQTASLVIEVRALGGVGAST